MKIAVLAGSPKGEKSVTLQYVRWLEKRYPEHEFGLVQAASRVSAFERDEAAFNDALEVVRRSELVLWAFPLYVYTVCSQYKRFIELIGRRGAADAFSGKYAASLSTSIHYFDHTAHAYVRDVAEDLGQRFIASFSPKMIDLMKPSGRAQFEAFADRVFAAVASGSPCQRVSAPLPKRPTTLPSATPAAAVHSSKRTVVLVDYPEGPAGAMARRFASAVEGEVEAIDLESLGMKGGCLGCLRCATKNRCVYEEGSDTFASNYRARILNADILVFAGTIVDRALSARWKAFFDRSFFNTHRRTLAGKQFVFLVDGPLSALANQREIFAAYAEWQGGAIAATVSNEVPISDDLDALLDSAASLAVSAAERGAAAIAPATFLGVGGMKVFRDDIFGGLKIVFKADHRAYKRTGEYDYLQANPLKRFALWLAYWITWIPPLQRWLDAHWPDNMIRSYQPIIRAAAPQGGR